MMIIEEINNYIKLANECNFIFSALHDSYLEFNKK